MVYTTEQLQEIGREVASCWGGECIGYNIEDNGDVTYECIEHGEFFVSTIKVKDLPTFLNQRCS